MLIVWGKYGLQHPRATATLEWCPSCNQDALDRRAVERVWHFMAIPLLPLAWGSITTCTQCTRVGSDLVELPVPPRRRMTWRIVASWCSIVTAVIVALVGSSVTGRLSRDRAAAPQVDDEGRSAPIAGQACPAACSGTPARRSTRSITAS